MGVALGALGTLCPTMTLRTEDKPTVGAPLIAAAAAAVESTRSVLPQQLFDLLGYVPGTAGVYIPLLTSRTHWPAALCGWDTSLIAWRLQLTL